MKALFTCTLFVATTILFKPFTLSAQAALFVKNFGGSRYDAFSAVCQIPDGFILCGKTMSFGDTLSDVYLVKTDHEGNLIWQRTFGGSQLDGGNWMTLCKDGGFLIVGHTESYGNDCQGIVIKTDAGGNEQWMQILGGEEDDALYGAIETPQGDFLVTGYTTLPFAVDVDLYLAKLNARGEVLWQKTYGDAGPDVGRQIIIAPDNDYVVVGRTSAGNDNNNNLYLLKTDTGGNIQWQKTFGGPGDDRGYSIAATPDGYILAGVSTNVSNDSSFIHLTKTDAQGNQEWSELYVSGIRSAATSVGITPDAGFIISGYTYNDDSAQDKMIVVQTDEQGHELWRRMYGSIGINEANSIIGLPTGGYAIAGAMSETENNPDAALLRITPDGVVTTITNVPEKSDLYLSPNPMSDATVLHLGIYSEYVDVNLTDLAGRTLKQWTHVNTEQMMIPKDEMPDGIYIITVRGSDRSLLYTSRLVVN